MGPNLRRFESRIRCLLGDHELATDPVPAKPADGDQKAEPARLRLRCIWCGYATPGWEQTAPAYRRTYDGKNQAIPNPKLDAILAADAASEPLAAVAGGTPEPMPERRKNVTKFTVAKRSRSR